MLAQHLPIARRQQVPIPQPVGLLPAAERSGNHNKRGDSNRRNRETKPNHD